MLAAVTGACGHVGANLIRALLAEGREVRAIAHRDMRGIQGLDVEVFEGDVLKLHSMLEAIRGAEIVYHLAAHISIWAPFTRSQARQKKSQSMKPGLLSAEASTCSMTGRRLKLRVKCLRLSNGV